MNPASHLVSAERLASQVRALELLPMLQTVTKNLCDDAN